MSLSTKSIVSVLLVVGSVALGYFLVWPKWTNYQTARDLLAVQEEDQLRLQEAQAELNKFLDEFKSHATEAEILNNALPLGDSEFHNVLNNLDIITRQNGVSLGGITIVERPETDTLGAAANSIQPVDLSFSVSGSYAAFKNFLTRLESNLRLMDVTSLTIQIGETPNSMGFTLNFRTYYQK